MHQHLVNPDRPASATEEFAASMKLELAGARLECLCRETVDAIIDKIIDRSHSEERDAALDGARAMRDRIKVYLTLLAELDDLTSDERDHSCSRRSRRCSRKSSRQLPNVNRRGVRTPIGAVCH